MELVNFVGSAQVLSMAEQCLTFEKNFAKKQGREHAVLVNSGSSANLILIQSLLNLGRLKKGDTVGVSALTWSTNVMPIIQLGLVPLVIDCEVETLNVLRDQVEKVYSPQLKGLFLTNALGFCADIDAIREFCEERKIIFLEDNCESLGSKFQGQLLGNFGLASTFSTYVGHHLSTIEGGLICTDDDELYEMLVMVRSHGWSRNLSEEKKKELRSVHGIDPFFDRYTFYDLGYNVRPTEITGFIGNLQLPYWDEIVSKREQNFKRFHEVVVANPELFSLGLRHMDVISNFSMPVIAKNKELFRKYRERFEFAQVEIRPIIAGDISSQPFYQKYAEGAGSSLNACLIHENGFYFGNNPELKDNEIFFLCNLLKP